MPEAAPDRRSIQQSLRNLLEDEIGGVLLRCLTEDDLQQIAQQLVSRDVYACGTMARKALSKLMPAELADKKAPCHIEHLLWCAWRSARRDRPPSSQTYEFVNLHFAGETAGYPTVIVTPMVLPPCDIFPCIGAACSDREIAVYGERYEPPGDLQLPHNVTLAADTKSGLACIIRTLKNGGVFCTYPDFVYSGHLPLYSQMLGQQRPFSKAFVSICASVNAMLLPVQIERGEGKIFVRISEPIIIRADSGSLPAALGRQAYLSTIVHLLESAILAKPEQWQLLGTLSVEVSDVFPSTRNPSLA